MARHAVDEIAGRFRVVCLCGWETKFYGSEREAIETWGLHRGRRLTDQSLEAEAASA